MTDSKWYIITVKLRGKAKTKEQAKENCKLGLIHFAHYSLDNIEIIDVNEVK